MKKILFLSIVASLLLSAFQGFSQKKPLKGKIDPVQKIIDENTSPVVEETDSSKIDWTNQYVEAKGWAVIDTVKFKNPVQAELMAKSAAIAIAQRNLLETVKGVRVVGEKKVVDLIPESDYVYTRVEGIIKGAEMIGEPVVKKGYVEVLMRVPLYQPAQGTGKDVKPEENSIASLMLKQLKENTGKYTDKSVGTVKPDETVKEEEIPDHLLFDLGGQKFDPALFPLVVDESGKVIMDFSQYYDPKSGKMPKVLQIADDKVKELGIEEGIDILKPFGVLPGKIIVSDKDIPKLEKWIKVGKKIWDWGKTLLLLL